MAMCTVQCTAIFLKKYLFIQTCSFDPHNLPLFIVHGHVHCTRYSHFLKNIFFIQTCSFHPQNLPLCIVHGHLHCTVYSHFLKEISFFYSNLQFSPTKSTTVPCTWPCTLYRVQLFILKISLFIQTCSFRPQNLPLCIVHGHLHCTVYSHFLKEISFFIQTCSFHPQNLPLCLVHGHVHCTGYKCTWHSHLF